MTNSNFKWYYNNNTTAPSINDVYVGDSIIYWEELEKELSTPTVTVSNTIISSNGTTWTTYKEKEAMKHGTMSKVSVLVVDTDARVPLEKRILKETEPFWTEDNNEDLFYSINLGDLLEKHNEYRKTVVWEEKDCNGVTHTKTGLPEIKFSDLKKEVICYVKITTKNVQ